MRSPAKQNISLNYLSPFPTAHQRELRSCGLATQTTSHAYGQPGFPTHTHNTYFPLPHSAGRTVQAPGTSKRLQMLFPKPGISFPSLHAGGPSSKTQMSPCPPQCLSVPKAHWLLLLCAPEAASHHHADITSLCSGTLCPLQRRPPKTVSQSGVQDLLSTSWGWGTDWIDPTSLMALQVIFMLASSLQYAKCCTLSCVGCTAPSGKSTVGTEYRN